MGAWLDIHEAAEYLRFTVSGLRSALYRRELLADGRGKRGIAMFRQATLDEFLERRARDAEEKAKAKDIAAGRRAARPGSVPDTGEIHLPQDRPAAGARSSRAGRVAKGRRPTTKGPARNAQPADRGRGDEARGLRSIVADWQASKTKEVD